MPSLIAFGRTWGVGSDDFVYPSVVESIFRFLWIVVILVIYTLHHNRLAPDCRHGYLVDLLYSGTLTMLTWHLIASLMLAFFSARGCIIDHCNRRTKRVAFMLYIKLALHIMEFFWAVAATKWAFDHANSACDPAVIWTLRCAVIASWLAFAIVWLSIFMAFDTLGSKKDKNVDSTSLWKTRCNILCCCLNRDEESNQAFDDIAKIFSNFFKGIDVVPTDIAAGLVLLQTDQLNKKNKKIACTPLSQTDCPTTPSHNPILIDWQSTSSCAHFMRFASASYGWSLFVYSNPMTAPYTLASKCTCMCGKYSDTDSVSDHNCCQFNLTTITSMTHIKKDDILFTSFTNRVYEIPFFVSLDRRTKSIVIAIRGTLSLKDALTDLTGNSECIDIEEFGCGRAHKGILSAAKYIQQTLARLKLIEQALEIAPGFRLVICGHSLGAGAASLLSMLLKPQYPDLICYAFSPPSIVTLDLAKRCEDFICSVILGQDLVPRLGVITMEHLKLRLMRLVRDSNQPKYSILATGCWNILCGSNTSKECDALLARNFDEIVDGTDSDDSILCITSLQQAIANTAKECNQNHQDVIPLYVAGKILFLDEISNTSCLCGVAEYDAGWIQTETLSEILVTPKMLLHHLPNIVLSALEKISTTQSTVVI